MSALNNDYLYEQLGTQGFTFSDDIFISSGAPTAQSGAGPIKGQCHRIVACATASASLMMKSILSNDNPGVVFLINDSANTVVIFPFKNFATGATDVNENINGVATGFSVTAANSAIFVASLVQPKRKGGSQSGGTTPALNWSAALLT